MDGTTPNLNLVKPGRNGTADIEVLDQNMEKIDAWAGEKETELSGKEPKIDKNSGFNKDKSDSVTTDSSIILATAKAIKTVWDALTNHRNSTSNPHTVTKSQVGLGNVPNYTITDSTTDGSSLKFGSAKAVKTVWNKALEILGLTNINKNAIQNNTEQIENLMHFYSLTLEENASINHIGVYSEGGANLISKQRKSFMKAVLYNGKTLRLTISLNLDLKSGLKIPTDNSLQIMLNLRSMINSPGAIDDFIKSSWSSDSNILVRFTLPGQDSGWIGMNSYGNNESGYKKLELATGQIDTGGVPSNPTQGDVNTIQIKGDVWLNIF